MRNKANLLIVVLLFLIAGCCKDKSDNPCVSSQFIVTPFIERYADFWCTGDDEYTYIFRKKSQIDSLTSCAFSPPVAFPVDETDMLYIMVGRMAYHYRDTFETRLLKDSCLRKFTCEVNMVQQDTAFNTFPGVVSIFCEVESIPADYQVEIKYKYVPIE